MTNGFTTKQQNLIDCYAGDIKEAAEKANLSYGYARQLLTKPNILEAIRNRQDTEVRPKDIADRQERQAFWTKTERDESQSTSDRLRASELLGKSEIDFGEKRVTVDMSLADIAARMGIEGDSTPGHGPESPVRVLNPAEGTLESEETPALQENSSMALTAAGRRGMPLGEEGQIL